MTSSGRTARLPLSAAVGLLVLICAAFEMSSIAPPVTMNSLPTDTSPNHSCAVSTSTFNGWFHSGTASLDGLVDPADSLHFPDNPNCSFYEWSEHMFLWLTSPVSGTQVFRTSTFYDVSPPNTAFFIASSSRTRRRLPDSLRLSRVKRTLLLVFWRRRRLPTIPSFTS